MRAFARTRELVARRGAVKALWALAMSTLKPNFMICQVQTRPNLEYHNDAEHAINIDIRLASADELVSASRELPDQLSRAFIESALDRGDVCAAAFVGSTMVAWQWSSFTIAEAAERLWVSFERPFRYGYKGFTRPEYRGRRIARQVMRFADSECLKRGYTDTIVYVETHNYASLANLARLGNRCVGYAGYLKLFNSYLTFRTPGVKRHAFRFYVENG